MNDEITLAAQARKETGKSAAGKLRREGRLPGIIYGVGEPKTVSFDASRFAALQRHHTSENVMIDLEIEGDRTHKVLMREVQHHPLTSLPLHVDFYELSMTKAVRVSVPIECTGAPIGVTRDGGVLEQHLREVELECLPSDIPEEVVVDVSALELGHGLTVVDLPLDSSTFTVITGGDIAVASVSAPRVEEATEEVEAAAGAAGAEPEVLGEKKSEEEEGESQK